MVSLSLKVLEPSSMLLDQVYAAFKRNPWLKRLSKSATRLW